MTNLDSICADEKPWESVAGDPIINFECADGIHGFILNHLMKSHFHAHKLELWWADYVVEITGPKTLHFLREFSAHKATFIRADGSSILSVRCRKVEEVQAELDAAEIEIDYDL
jgi:hypothetical protein